MLGRFRGEDVLDHQKIQTLEHPGGKGGLGFGDHRVFPHHVEGPDFPGGHTVEHFRCRKPRDVGELSAPDGFHVDPGRLVFHQHVAGEEVGQRAHVAGALDIVLAAQGSDPGAGLADVSGEQGQVGQGVDIVRAVGVLGQAHAPDEDGPLAADGLGRGVQILTADAGHFTGLVHINVGQALFQGFVSQGLAFTEFLIGHALVDDDLAQGIDPVNVRAWPGGEMDLGGFHQVRLPGIGQDKLGPFPLEVLLHLKPDNGVGEGGVGAGEEIGFRLFKILEKQRGGTVAQLLAQAGFGRPVAKAGAVVDVVGAHHLALELLTEVGFLIEDLGTGEHAHTFRAVGVDDLFQAAGRLGDGLLPGNIVQGAVLPDGRLGETLFIVDKVLDGQAFDAEILVIDFFVPARGLSFDRDALVVQLHFKVTANAAIGTNDGYG